MLSKSKAKIYFSHFSGRRSHSVSFVFCVHTNFSSNRIWQRKQHKRSDEANFIIVGYSHDLTWPRLELSSIVFVNTISYFLFFRSTISRQCVTCSSRDLVSFFFIFLFSFSSCRQQHSSSSSHHPLARSSSYSLENNNKTTVERKESKSWKLKFYCWIMNSTWNHNKRRWKLCTSLIFCFEIKTFFWRNY